MDSAALHCDVDTYDNPYANSFPLSNPSCNNNLNSNASDYHPITGNNSDSVSIKFDQLPLVLFFDLQDRATVKHPPCSLPGKSLPHPGNPTPPIS